MESNASRCIWQILVSLLLLFNLNFGIVRNYFLALAIEWGKVCWDFFAHFECKGNEKVKKQGAKNT